MPHRRAMVGKFAAVFLKLAVTAACFWYVAHQIDFAVFVQTFPAINPGWIALAVLVTMVQLPLIGLRWFTILDTLPGHRVSRGDAIAITWISVFLGQVLPFAAADAMRVWLVSRLGRDWRTAIVSVLIDRGAAVAILFAYGFFILLMPSALTALGGYRDAVVACFGAISLGVAVGLAVVPWIAPVLRSWRYTRWIGTVASGCHDVLATPRSGLLVVALATLVHTLTILCVWCVGLALGIPLTAVDAAVLVVLMLGVALIPVSIGGWGLREVAVVALLGAHGVSAEIALSLSVTFGLVIVVGSLPGAIIWAVYSPAQPTAVKAEI
jgi:glycosyltransferase 2 family protein